MESIAPHQLCDLKYGTSSRWYNSYNLVCLQDLLALELGSSRRGFTAADCLQVHRKGIPGQEEEEPLAHELHCVPRTNQVDQSYSAGTSRY